MGSATSGRKRRWALRWAPDERRPVAGRAERAEWVSYLGYNATTSTTPGHLFEVTYNSAGAGSATFTVLDNVGSSPFGDQPANAIVDDPNTGDLYAASDFGVVELAADDTASGWVLAAQNLPVVTVAGLTINPGARQLLAATHGRGAYQLTLP